MKIFILKIVFYTIALLPAIIIVSCKNVNKDVTKEFLDKAFGKKYELRKINIKNTTEQTSSASYFLIIGNYDSKSTQKSKIRFYFLNYLNEYQLLEKESKEVYIKIEDVGKPYITFETNCHINGNYDDSDYYNICNPSDNYLYGKIIKTTIHCKESDFQPDININDLK